MKISVVITGGGASTRFGKKDKLLELINGKEVILHSVDAFLPLEPFEFVISSSQKIEDRVKSKLTHIKNLKFVRGGATRQESVFNALKICDNPDYVLIHDAARPLIKFEQIKNCLEKTIETGAAIAAVRAVDTIKVVDENMKIIDTPNRDFLWHVQTPQVFDYRLILNAHERLAGQSFSDDAGMLESLNIPVYISEGDYSNIKITVENDIKIAEQLINQ